MERNTFNKQVSTPRNQNANATELMRHKAAKYHYKIQHLLNTNYVSKGVAVPQGYEGYMRPFEG